MTLQTAMSTRSPLLRGWNVQSKEDTTTTKKEAWTKYRGTCGLRRGLTVSRLHGVPITSKSLFMLRRVADLTAAFYNSGRLWFYRHGPREWRRRAWRHGRAGPGTFRHATRLRTRAITRTQLSEKVSLACHVSPRSASVLLWWMCGKV